MKNKKVTYILILSVMAVWGVIFYRVFMAAQSDTSFIRRTSYSRATYGSLDDYERKDTFTLALNYRDPFLGGRAAPEATVVPVSATAIAAPVVPAAPAVNWEPIKYTGYISNSGLKRTVAIMNINGREYMISEGQKADGVTLLKSHRDSVKVSYQGKTRFIRIQ